MVLYWLQIFMNENSKKEFMIFRAQPQHFYDRNFQTRLKKLSRSVDSIPRDEVRILNCAHVLSCDVFV